MYVVRKIIMYKKYWRHKPELQGNSILLCVTTKFKTNKDPRFPTVTFLVYLNMS